MKTSKQILSEVSEAKKDILIAFLSMLPGANYRVEWKREMKTRKGVIENCLKFVSAIVAAGINYDNKKSVQIKRENGELPIENAGLPWGTWALFPRIIEHKNNYYLRFYPGAFDGEMSIAFYRNGKNVDKNELKDICLASEFTEKKEIDCFTIKLDNLESLKII